MDPSPQPPSLAPDPGAAPRMSFVARLMNVFATPADVFEQVKEAPSSPGHWVVPGLLLVLVSWLGAAIVFSQPAIRQQFSEITEKQLQKQIERSHIPEDKAAQMRSASEMVQKILIVLAPLAPAFVFIWLWGLILWLPGKFLFKSQFGYMKAVEVIGLSNMIAVLEAIVKTLLIVVTGNLFAGPSLALLVKDFDPQNSMHGVLALVNIMSLWLLAVRSIGLARLAQVSFGKAAVVVFGAWVAYTGFIWVLAIIAKKAFAG